MTNGLQIQNASEAIQQVATSTENADSIDENSDSQSSTQNNTSSNSQSLGQKDFENIYALEMLFATSRDAFYQTLRRPAQSKFETSDREEFRRLLESKLDKFLADQYSIADQDGDAELDRMFKKALQESTHNEERYTSGVYPDILIAQRGPWQYLLTEQLVDGASVFDLKLHADSEHYNYDESRGEYSWRRKC